MGQIGGLAGCTIECSIWCTIGNTIGEDEYIQGYIRGATAHHGLRTTSANSPSSPSWLTQSAEMPCSSANSSTASSCSRVSGNRCRYHPPESGPPPFPAETGLKHLLFFGSRLGFPGLFYKEKRGGDFLGGCLGGGWRHPCRVAVPDAWRINPLIWP